MVRLLKNISSLALFFIGFYIVLLLVISLSTAFTFKVEHVIFRNNKTSANNYRRIQDFHSWLATNHGGNALILGSSTANMNIDPIILQDATDIDFFNCGTNAQTIKLSEKILRYAVERSKVDYVILDVYPELWNYKSPEPVIIWTTHNPALGNKFMFNMVASSQSVNAWNYYFYFLVKRWLPLTRFDMEKIQHTRVYKTKGHVCIDDTVKTDYAYDTTYNTMSADNAQALQHIVEICRE